VVGVILTVTCCSLVMNRGVGVGGGKIGRLYALEVLSGFHHATETSLGNIDQYT
jgi:hypothetical protein